MTPRVNVSRVWSSHSSIGVILPPKKKAIDQLLHDMAERSHLINYPEFREKGWHIGSGPTEAQCGTTTDRIKGKGRRWNPDNALAMMALESLEQSHQWSTYWNL